MLELSVGIIGAGKGGTALIETMADFDNIKIMGIADINPLAPGLRLARNKGINCFDDPKTMLKACRFDVIFEVTGDKELVQQLQVIIPDFTTLVDARTANIMLTVIRDREELLKIKEIKEQLSVILNSAQEGIQMVDKNGIIQYVNEGFTRITGIPASQRIGTNVFDVSADGALAEVLKTGKPCIGKPNRAVGSNAQVISNASPVIVNGEMTGAVVVFQDISEVIRLTKELKRSTTLIDGLKDEIKKMNEGKGSFEDIICKSSAMKDVINMAKKAAREDSTLLITGESGTGKELFANALHGGSRRSNKPFIKVNCAAIPENLLESELFGYEAGAFTGAGKLKLGKFELANGGTIFLDEIGDMSHVLQAKLLRVIQEQEIERVGGTHPIKIDVRIISATNQNLLELIRRGRFREDLYFRLNVINIHIPPLRERKEDIVALAETYIKEFNRKFYKNVKGLTNKAQELLLSYQWPGNVRELKNIFERTILMAEGEWITEDLLLPYFNQLKKRGKDKTGILSLEEMECKMIKMALEEYGTSVRGKQNAANALKISLATLYNKIKKYGIND
ncbi:PAS modulated sigma54 specific transcriptional regulator, Fis family [Tepidanaerobacter acetatoxydans Re1]|uniref:PAS modulated sigma54 specific transcriptional regulator, Fis family n=1 Tax=Tepidanaerobacter acetatoxydans (strain DSM 21804 / JCM 16047 / Re1) TaxID=1209989 RepID=F4LRG8_TEPAE|nr:sigma 54-interacting transcriptional regulator [Tepidanaerobacter acetatoxydans]AEE90231.1 PAS modulated sigma54 specific transcriptional regulator, Fis family [Tepidanaerobacter acetatoxydans Re1]CCP24693.1 PAS modulated sigma54 specific transcriptional regulator, Fis family [Tepidanaerobacter acetatoxydans Re1]